VSSDEPRKGPSGSRPNQRIKIRFVVRETLGVVLMAAILFAAAGTTSWTAGWIGVTIVAAWAASTAYVLFTKHPDLVAERLRPSRGTKRWDTAILSLVAIGSIARLIVAGLDFRYGWSSLPAWLQAGGAVASIAGYALVVWSVAANAFFSQGARIQEERGHMVETGGPYRLVRHPGYMGTVLHEIGMPLLLGSWWALVPGAIDAGLMILRTNMEDGMLRNELAGYEDYAGRVRYRIVPGLW
jgi:protein-S-isoprenylcysteine O-methyltransferase Ste14